MFARFAALSFVLGAAMAANAASPGQGRHLSIACQACHGAAGLGTAPDIPNLAGQKERYLAAQLTAFRSGDRKHELMNALAAQLKDEEIADLAAFWSSMPVGGAADAHGAADPAAEFRKSRMEFPKDFPGNFVMYAETINAESKSAQRSYANRLAVDAARAGKPLPPGSAIINLNYSTKPGATAGSLVADKVVSYAGMASAPGWGDGVPELLRNGDWSYALFDDKQVRRDSNYARCLACHKPKAEDSYVFGLQAIAASTPASND